MQDRQNIEDFQANAAVRGVYLIGLSSRQQSRNGPYWRLELRDATGAVEAKIWSPLSLEYAELPVGRFVRLEGQTSLFREQVQVTVERLELVLEEEAASLDPRLFLPSSPRPALEMLEEIEALCKAELRHKPWRKFALSVLGDPDLRAKLLLAPAAKSVHHAYCGGLLEHMLSVARMSLAVAECHARDYPGELDRQTLLCAALFHDIGKVRELSGGLTPDYTDSGRMLGHIVQGLILLDPFLRKAGVEEGLALHLQHLISSHHGQHDFGSPTLPMTPEAFILHHADDMDAKLAQLRSVFKKHAPPSTPNLEPGPGEGETEDESPTEAPEQLPAQEMAWTPWNSLLGRYLAQPPRTPVAEAEGKNRGGRSSKKEETGGQNAAKRPGKEAQQCSLL